ncbi:MAG: Hsp70 family protein [Proteobacteria bacterium]|nr:Hsp70 family protein [Pseudomonadota bacterium]
MGGIYGGIDFGTTNSSAALSESGKIPYIVPLEGPEITIPTALFFGDNQKVSFGREAMRRYMLGEQGRCMRSIKRILGTSLMKTGTLVNGRSVKFEDILKCFLRHLKRQMDEAAGQSVENVVLGRPVHFRDNDAEGDVRAEGELRQAARETGFAHIEFQYEPIAAAFAHEAKLKAEKLACVVDIGGGTSDFTIIRLGGGRDGKPDRRDDILASAGVRIGGNDFDKELALKAFMPELGMYTTYGEKSLFVPTSQYFELAEWSSVNNLYTYQNFRIVNEILVQAHEPEKYGRLREIMEKERGHNLLAETENLKIALTSADSRLSRLNFLDGCPEITVKSADFESSIQEEMQKLEQVLKDCLVQAGVAPEKVELVILTGGSTEIPVLQRSVRRIFPQALLSQENKLASVGLGLAFDSRRRFG